MINIGNPVGNHIKNAFEFHGKKSVMYSVESHLWNHGLFRLWNHVLSSANNSLKRPQQIPRSVMISALGSAKEAS
jgi:hypothetical protein